MIYQEYKKISCSHCESKYYLKFTYEEVTNALQYCSFCGEEFEEDLEEKEEYENEIEKYDEYFDEEDDGNY